MSSSQPETAIYTVDTPEAVEKKLLEAFTPANRINCPLFLFHYFLLTESDVEIDELHHDCTVNGKSCIECKKELAKRVNSFLETHRRHRRQMRSRVERMLE